MAEIEGEKIVEEVFIKVIIDYKVIGVNLKKLLNSLKKDKDVLGVKVINPNQNNKQHKVNVENINVDTGLYY